MIYDSLREELHSKKNVVGVGIGEKWINGVNTGEEAILVFVKKKEDIIKLNKIDIIPSKINGIKTDVVGKTGILKSFALKNRIRPVSPGYSCGNIRVTAGTIGGIFKDWQGQTVILSNNHVLANTNNCVLNKDIIVQPGTADNGYWVKNIIGILKGYRQLVRGNTKSYNSADKKTIFGYNLEDSAICKLNNQLEFDPNIPMIGKINGFNDDLSVGTKVQKTGRTTGYTTNKIIAINTSVIVSYGRGLVFLFKDQIMTSVMGAGGDSGSLLLDMNKNVVGLLFAGSNTITVFNRIRYPKSSWGLQLIN